MILDGYAAYVGKTLLDLEIAAVGREAGEANRRRVVDQLHGGLLRKQHHGRRFPCRRSAIRFFANEFLPQLFSHRPRRASTAIGCTPKKPSAARLRRPLSFAFGCGDATRYWFRGF
jgi:hypothetical protein